MCDRVIIILGVAEIGGLLLLSGDYFHRENKFANSFVVEFNKCNGHLIQRPPSVCLNTVTLLPSSQFGIHCVASVKMVMQLIRRLQNVLFKLFLNSIISDS